MSSNSSALPPSSSRVLQAFSSQRLQWTNGNRSLRPSDCVVESHRQPGTVRYSMYYSLRSLNRAYRVHVQYVCILPRTFTCHHCMGESSRKTTFSLCTVVVPPTLLLAMHTARPPGCRDRSTTTKVAWPYRCARRRDYCCAPVGIAEMAPS